MDKVKKTFLKKLGGRIASLREMKGLNQTQLASECDKDRQSINRLEKGNVNPSAYYLFQISQALGTSLKELLEF
ncbi:MAG TPA: helix-turn-helix transcriptional regulator [Chitinophagaceae bacterium]|jgi:transcriptional regulator with XRE-family HTH domain|nr:helix-turn-helix transcriptional regulator [Chitinophagaceae bacterium]